MNLTIILILSLQLVLIIIVNMTYNYSWVNSLKVCPNLSITHCDSEDQSRCCTSYSFTLEPQNIVIHHIIYGIVIHRTSYIYDLTFEAKSFNQLHNTDNFDFSDHVHINCILTIHTYLASPT